MDSWLPIWIVTRTELGCSSTVGTTSPRASTAMRSTAWLMSIPDGWIWTRAWADATSTTDDSGPVTVTGILGHDRLTHVQAGRNGPVVDLHGNGLADEGIEPHLDPRRVEVDDLDVAGIRCPDGDRDAHGRRSGGHGHPREVDRRAEAGGRDGRPVRPDGQVPDGGDVVEVADDEGVARLVQHLDGNHAGERLGAGRDDQARVEECGEKDCRELQRPVAKDELDGAAHGAQRPALAGAWSVSSRGSATTGVGSFSWRTARP